SKVSIRSTGLSDETLNAVAPRTRSSLKMRSASRIAATASDSLVSAFCRSHVIRSSPRRDIIRSIPMVCLLFCTSIGTRFDPSVPFHVPDNTHIFRDKISIARFRQSSQGQKISGVRFIFLHGARGGEHDWGKPSHYYRRPLSGLRGIVVAGLAPVMQKMNRTQISDNAQDSSPGSVNVKVLPSPGTLST